MMVPIPGIIEPLAPVAHPDAATPEVFAAHGAAWDVGVAASSSSGTATQPPRLHSNGTSTATAHRKPEA
jgi:hypothetical protein